MALDLAITLSVEQPNGMPIAVALSAMKGSTAQDANSVTLIGKLTSRRITIADVKAGHFGSEERIPGAEGAWQDNTTYLASDVRTAINPSNPLFVQAANSGNSEWNNSLYPTVVLTFSNPIALGHGVAGHATFDNGHSAITIDHIDDDKGNIYNLGQSAPIVGDGQEHVAFYLGNITNGPTAITVHFVNLGGFKFSQAVEIANLLAVSDPLDVQEGRAQLSPGSATDAISSSAGGTPTTAANDMIIGMSLVEDTTIAAGTAFTLRDTGNDGSGNAVLAIEDKLAASISSQRATFTAPGGTGHYSTIMLALKKAA